MEKEKKEKEVEKEEKTTKQKESKGIKTTSFQTTLIVILLICVAALGGWIVGASKVNNLYTEKLYNDGQKSANETTTTTKETKDVKTNDEVKPLDLTKSLNTTNIKYSDAKELEDGYGQAGLSVKHDESLTRLVIDWQKFGPHSGASAWTNENVEYDIKNISGTVKKAFVHGEGQDVTGTTLYYLMEDGTVEYTKMFTRNFDSKGTLYFNINYTYEKDSDGKITGEHFESQGKVPGVKDVVKIYGVGAVYDDGSDGPKIGGYATTIGATRDGSFYDLGKPIREE